MTQAILNNSNIINSLNSSEQSGLYSKFSDENSFDKIIADKIDTDDSDKKTKNLTLDDLQKEIKKSKEEAEAENSLDLTLMKDINSVIENIQNIPEVVQNILPEDLSEIDEVISEESAQVLTELSEQNANSLPELPQNEIQETLPNNLSKSDEMTSKESIQTLAALCKQNEGSSFEFTENENQETNLQEEVNMDKITNLVPEKGTEVNSTETDNTNFELDEDRIKELKIESVQSDFDFNSESQTAMDGQSPQEYAIKAIISKDMPDFEINVENMAAQKQNIQHEAGNRAIEPSKIIEQISKQLNNLQNSSKVNIVLNPESLGKVSVQIVKSAEGMSAQFTVASQDAKEIIMKGLDGLKENLLSHGIGVDNVSVKLSDTQKSEYGQDWTEQENSQGRNKEQARQNKEQDKGQFQRLMAQVLPEENNEILE